MNSMYIKFLMIFALIMRVNANTELQEVKDFSSNPGNLRMFHHIPGTLPDTLSQTPLVIALHGCSQNAKTIAIQSGWNKLADKYHFIVLYPQQKRINNLSKCFNWFRSKDIDSKNGETASIKSMIDHLRREFEIDTTQVFAYGLSAGAAMSVSLLANFPCTFSSGAIFAGGPYKMAVNPLAAMKVLVKPSNKTPKEWGNLLPPQALRNCTPKLVVVHGREDIVVNINNSHELIDQWSFLHHTDNLPDTIITAFASNPLIERSSYHDPSGEEVIVFYKISESGHTLPVDPGDGEAQGGKTGMFAADKGFFSTYSMSPNSGWTSCS